MTLTDRLKLRARQRAVNYFRARLTMIKVEPEQGLFNLRCFDNAVDYVRRFPATEVVEVIFVYNGEPILHYINRNSVGTYLETTLGYQAATLEYYLLRTIHAEDHKWLAGEFDRANRSWSREFTTWWQRWFFGLDKIL